jgi:uncharacterized membrane protein YoaK (UPF0700 family)
MTRYDRRSRILAACLSALAGYVDAIGFLTLGGFFVSFMSGNTTRLGVGLAQGASNAALDGGLIGLFVLGVVAGSLIGRLAKARRRPALLLFVAALLALAASLRPWGAVPLPAVLMAIAMGAENTVFERDGEVSIGVTYMTGTLVKLGQRLTAVLLGGDRLAWAPYLLLWLGLAAGALCGAAVYPVLGLKGLWVAAVAACALAVAAAWIGPEERDPA